MNRAVLAVLLLLGGAGCTRAEDDRAGEKPDARAEYLAAAGRVAEWLQAQAIQRPEGKVWAADPQRPETVQMNLYSGSSGVVLFFLEAARVLREPEYLEEARAGADYLLASLPAEIGPGEAGLYTGYAGIGFTLLRAWLALGERKYRDGAARVVDLLHEGARPSAGGLAWDEVTDVVGGSAGTGLFLLWYSRELKIPEVVDLADAAGVSLLARALPAETGIQWAMDPDFPRRMPNFSHGTAGVAYFLAELSLETGDPAYLEAAVRAGEYLLSITSADGLVFHDEPDGRELYYLGWCHGPVGTGRLYQLLWEITGEERWKQALHAGARGVMESGIPEQRTPGFWNNAGQCCGSAGVARFFRDLQLASGSEAYGAFSERVAADLLSRATKTPQGWCWKQAEHRQRPEHLLAQTGYMQGAAGIGIALLQLGEEIPTRMRLILPDSPW